jgi:hypothetical protein
MAIHHYRPCTSYREYSPEQERKNGRISKEASESLFFFTAKAEP